MKIMRVPEKFINGAGFLLNTGMGSIFIIHSFHEFLKMFCIGMVISKLISLKER